MSSIAEGYRTVIKSQSERAAEEDVASGMNELPVDLITSAANELVESLQERCKWHDTHENTLVIQTGKEDTPGIIVEVKGYATQEGVVTAAQQEDSTKVKEDLPPVSNIPDYPTEDTDLVASVRKYNTDQYMKHSPLNPKKFG
jgi:hypothetical protein